MRTPMSPDEHRLLSNPTDAAIVALQEHKATRKDLWTLWFRCRVTLVIVRSHFKEQQEAVEPIANWIEAFWEQHYRLPIATPVEITLEQLADLRMVIDFANEVQHATNREVMLQAFRHTHQYCIDKGHAIDAERTTHGAVPPPT